MGLLDWLKNNPDEKAVDSSQLDLFGKSQELPAKRERSTGATVRQRYTKTMQDKGASKRGIARATRTVTEEVTGEKLEDLYRNTQSKKGARSSMPPILQDAIMTGEIVANVDLKNQDIQGNEDDRDRQIVDSARESGRKARKLFPW